MAHNAVYYDTGFNGIRQFSTAEIDVLAERILRLMAAGTYTGTITIGATNPIGTFVDTTLVGSPGSTNITVASNTYTLSQITTTTLGASANAPTYVGLDTTSIPNQVSLRESITTRENLADEILSRMVTGTGGTNAYYLGTSAPADGGTWVSLGNLLDTTNNFTTVVTSYVLWKRTTSNASLTNRNPIKIESNYLKEFTDVEVQALIKTIEERIIATGVGTYALQQTVPGTGTWVNCGTVTDTRYNTVTATFNAPTDFQSINYDLTITYTSSYESDNIYEGAIYQLDATYTSRYSTDGTYTTEYSIDSYQRDYLRSYQSSVYDREYVRLEYFGLATEIYGAGTYVGSASYDIDYVTTYIGTTLTDYDGGFAVGLGGTINPSQYTQGTIGNEYFGPPSYEFEYLITPITFSSNYLITSNYDTGYDGIQDYTGTYSLIYTGTYNTDVPYEGSFVFGNYITTYIGTLFLPFDATYSVTYESNFISTQTYERDFVSQAGYDVDFTGTVSYQGTYTGVTPYDTTVVGTTSTTISNRTLWRRIA